MSVVFIGNAICQNGFPAQNDRNYQLFSDVFGGGCFYLEGPSS